MKFVLDASVAVPWMLEDEQDSYARSVKLSLPLNEAMVPWLWHLEVLNTLTIAARRGRIPPAKIQPMLTALSQMPITTIDTPIDGLMLLPLCQHYGLTAYDALYLHLAQTHQLPLATLDRQLADAAASAGVALFAPSAS